MPSKNAPHILRQPPTPELLQQLKNISYNLQAASDAAERACAYAAERAEKNSWRGLARTLRRLRRVTDEYLAKAGQL